MSTLPQGSLPRLKPIYPVYRLDEATFRVGAQLGITIELDDPEEHAWTLVGLLDGTRTVPQVVQAMQARFPRVGAGDVESVLVALDEAGLLEDARRTEPGGPELERWLGNVNYFSHFARLAGSAE